MRKSKKIIHDAIMRLAKHFPKTAEEKLREDKYKS